MSILVDKSTRLLVQGITGSEGLFHTQRMINYNTTVVAGVTPGKGGDWVFNGKIPVFDSTKTGVEMTGANASIIFVPARNAADAIVEAVDAGIPLIICITEGIPIKDMIKIRAYIEHKPVRLIGPNCPGVITPGQCNVGIIPGSITMPGKVGIVSRSGTLTYEVLYALKQAGMGVSSCVGIGGDPVRGTDFIDILDLFEADPQTSQIVLIGEIGGGDEERAAQYIVNNIKKPVVAFIAGESAPVGKRMGHAGAIIEGGEGRAGDKIKALWAVGVHIATSPEKIPDLLKDCETKGSN
jgi:succinyl-CoA synthetase alpha subunit